MIIHIVTGGAPVVDHNILLGHYNAGSPMRVVPAVGGAMVARADSLGPLMAAKVRAGAMAPGDFGVISGLTYCIGVAVAACVAGAFTHIVVAHFNGGWDDIPSWAHIGANIALGGTLWGFIILTSDSTVRDRQRVIEEMRPRLHGFGIRDQNIFLYHANTSGVAFAVCQDATIGEIAGYPY